MACASILLLGAESMPHLQISANGMTLHVEATPLDEALILLERRLHLTTVVMFEANALLASPVTANFSDVPIEKGIRRLLNDWNYVFVRDADSSRLKLYILGPKDHSVANSESEPFSAEKEVNAADNTIGVNATDAEQAKGVDLAGAEVPEDSPNTEDISIKLQSENVEDRLNAIKDMARVDTGDTGLEDIRDLVEQDPDPLVRATALDSLILYDTSDEAVQTLRGLAEGSDETLREMAMEQLEHLDEAAAATASVAQDSYAKY